MMTNRPTDAFLKDCYSNAEARLNQQIRCAPKLDEGCPVIDETGTVCGETDSLSIFKEFRKIYEDCLKKLESSPDGNTILKKLTPFTKIVDDLWEQNTMLVEAVEELEQEATCQVTNLQNKLDKSCQKMCEYRNDISSLIEMIRRLKNKVFDSSDLTFYTFCPDCAFGFYENRSSILKEGPTKTPVRRTRCSDNDRVILESDTPSNEDCVIENALNVYKEKNCNVLNESDLSYLKRKPDSLIDSRIRNNSNSRIALKSPQVLSNTQMSCDSLSNDDDHSLLEDRENESLSCINLLNISLSIPNKSMVPKKSCHCGCCMQKSADSCLKFYK